MFEEIVEIRSALNSIRTSVKRRDVFEYVCGEMDIKQDLPSLDVETSWSSTFNIIKKMYSCLREVNDAINRIVDIADLSIREWSSEKAYKVCPFLESAAQFTETKSGSNYITLSRTSKLLQFFVKKYKTIIQENYTPLMQIASSVLNNRCNSTLRSLNHL